MIIQSIRLKNFQPYVDVTIPVSEHLTAITGSSGSGKSAILRAVFQLIDNSISWDVCRRWDTDETRVVIVGDTHTIQRIKSKEKNEFILDKKKMEFTSKDVPREVQKALNVSDANIQKQRSLWFLIDQKPGNLSKILNNISGMSLIDGTIKESAQRTRDTQSEIRYKNTKITGLSSTIEALDFISDADTDLIEIEELEESIASSTDHLEDIKVIIHRILVETKILDSTVPESAVKELADIGKLPKEIEDKERKLTTIVTIVSNLSECLDVLNNAPSSSEFAEITKLKESIDKKSDTLKKIRFKISEISTVEKIIMALDKSINANKAELEKFGICPTCKRPMENQHG